MHQNYKGNSCARVFVVMVVVCWMWFLEPHPTGGESYTLYAVIEVVFTEVSLLKTCLSSWAANRNGGLLQKSESQS